MTKNGAMDFYQSHFKESLLRKRQICVTDVMLLDVETEAGKDKLSALELFLHLVFK